MSELLILMFVYTGLIRDKTRSKRYKIVVQRNTIVNLMSSYVDYSINVNFQRIADKNIPSHSTGFPSYMLPSTKIPV
jgi:hypothetical protein